MALGAGQRVEAGLLDAVHQLARLARGGHKVVPAPRDVRLFVETQNAPGDGVAVMVVVKEPAVMASLAYGCLNCLNVHTRHDTRPGQGVGMTIISFAVKQIMVIHLGKGSARQARDFDYGAGTGPITNECGGWYSSVYPKIQVENSGRLPGSRRCRTLYRMETQSISKLWWKTAWMLSAARVLIE